MTPDQLSAKIEGTIRRVSKSFGNQITATQEGLFEKIQILLTKLDLNPDGTIKQSQANRALLAKANVSFEKAFQESGYYQYLNTLPDEIRIITEANTAYFAFVKDQITVDAQYIKNLQTQTVGQLESLLANEGLESQVKKPILDIMSQNINTGASYSDLVKQLRGFVVGDEKYAGKLQSYAGQIVSDTLFNYSRAIQEAISTKVGLQFVVYSGGIMDDSREFCVERAGNYYHKDEVSAWANLDWQGKRRGTTESTIFIYAGGYRCLHQIIYVSELVVPDEVVRRAKTKGIYT